MTPQTYKAESMFQALQQIQNDLGPDAVVLSARELPAGPLWGKWKRTNVEVVAVLANEYAGKEVKKTPQPGINLTDDPGDIEWVGADPTKSAGAPELTGKARSWMPAHIQREDAAAHVDTLPLASAAAEPALAEVEKALAADDLPKGLRKNQQILLAQGLDEPFLERTLKVVANSVGPAKLQDEQISRKYLSQVLQAELQDLTGLTFRPPARMVSLVGPSGSGKTGLAAKLAFYYGQQGKKVVWVCADTVRSGAISEARLYTETLGIPLELVYTPGQFKTIFDKHSAADLILVDNPGYNPLDEAQMAELGSFLSEMPAHHNLLVMPASLKELDAVRMASALGLFGLNGLAVTKLDETASFGSVYNFARKTRLPLAYFSFGKTAVDHFQLASAQNLVAVLFEKGGFR